MCTCGSLHSGADLRVLGYNNNFLSSVYLGGGFVVQCRWVIGLVLLLEHDLVLCSHVASYNIFLAAGSA